MSARSGTGWFDEPMDPVVRVSGGLVRGVNRDGVSSFLGIPYAAPAVGADRYRAPQPVVPGLTPAGASPLGAGGVRTTLIEWVFFPVPY